MARRIHGDSVFLAAVDRAAAEYRFWHEFDRSRAPAATRAALRKFDKLTRELCAWLDSALGAEESPERQAARKINAAGLEARLPVFSRMERAHVALLELGPLRERAEQFLVGDKIPKSAPRMAASQLWALLPHHGIRVTIYENGAAVRLLVAIARASGDRSLTAQAAKKFLKETRPK